MQISIIGAGHVGLVSGVCFAERGHDVMCVDHDPHVLAKLRAGEAWFHEPGLVELLRKHQQAGRLQFGDSTAEAVEFGTAIFICVGTPSGDRGKADMIYVESVARNIAENLREYRLVVEKSTVPIQTGERIRRTVNRYVHKDVDFDVASNPEFLREGTAVQDTLHPDRVVVGVDSDRAEQQLREIYADFGCPIVATSIGSAELIKHASNSFLALKIGFANWLSRLCEASGADVQEVTKGMGLDRRIGPEFLDAGIGYGGSCFPKDVVALAHISEEIGCEAGLIRMISQINEDQLQRFYEKITKELWVVNGKTLAIWGLSFKPNTDDLRDAPALRLIDRLVADGAQLRVHDPVSMPLLQERMPELTYASDPLDATDGADALIVCTEWPEYAAVDLAEVVARLRVPMVFDGRNCLDRDRAEALGMTLFGIGKTPIGPSR